MASFVKRSYHVLGTSGRWVESENSSPIGEAAGFICDDGRSS
jgi:hypothetical protein